MFLNYKKWHRENYGFCIITGSPHIEQHHVVSVGMGNNRKKNIPEHLTLVGLVKPLHAELHTIGLRRFEAKYGINLHQQIIKQLMIYFHEVNFDTKLDDEFRNMDYLKGKK